MYRNLGEPGRALNCLDLALELASQGGDAALQADALNQRAGVHHLGGDHAHALRDLRQALLIARRLDDARRAAHCLINIGILATTLGDYPRALDALTEAHSLAREQLGDAATEAQCLINLGLLYESMGDDVRALKTCQLALSTLAGLDNRVLEAIITVNLGYAHKRLGQWQDAARHFEQALNTAQDSGQVKVEIAALDGLGQVRAGLGQTALALELHRQALSRARDTGDVESEMDALLNLGRVSLGAGDAGQALEHLSRALGAAQRAGRQKTAAEAHQLLAEAHEQVGDLRLALQHVRDFHRIEKLLFNEQGEQKTRQLTIQFDLERAQHEAEVYRLRTELEREAKERAEATVEQQRAQLQEKVLSLRALLGQNEELRQRLVLAATRSATLNELFLRRLSAELHDGPAQELGFALLKLDALEPGSSTLEVDPVDLPVDEELGAVQGAIQRALSEMRAIAGGMCLPELEHLSLTETLKRVIQAHRRRTRSEVALLLELGGGAAPGPGRAQDEAAGVHWVDALLDGGPAQAVPLPIKITLYRLAQESLTNAFKHAGGRGQTVRLGREPGVICLEVSDQGPGFVVDGALEHGEGLGLLGMRERVESLGGVFQLESAPGQGTRIRVRLPLHPAEPQNE